MWWLLLACTPDDSADPKATDDLDGDGHVADDCDDLNADVHPGAADTPYDGLDADCAGDDDYDVDGDGVRADPWGADCDDEDAAVAPGATETCDGRDEDCDGDVDEDATDGTWSDTDGDGYGVDLSGCGGAAVPGDCDDADAALHPGADEVCDGVDDDCDGAVDDHPTDGLTIYQDLDADGFGAVEDTACALPEGWSEVGGDCDDADAGAFPGAPQTCGRDDADCDGATDTAPVDAVTVYTDADGDGFGADSTATTGCDGVTVGGDCDDADPARSPAATETCDGTDEDCDGLVDDTPDATTWYPDDDADGFGADAEATPSCTDIDGWIEVGGDCDDTSAEVNPDAAESCNGRDDDCDGGIDLGAVDEAPLYTDADNDGWGDGEAGTGCSAGPGTAMVGGDCDDAEPTVHPDAEESCNAADDDCDGELDEDAADALNRYLDNDSDGYGDASTALPSCDAVVGRITTAGDCDDTDADVNPAAPESDDGGDDDCDGFVDEDFVTLGDMVISEIARQPYSGGTGSSLYANAQWFELTNTSTRDVDLVGWRFDEQDGNWFVLATSVVVPAGESVALCYGDPYFATATCAYTWGDSVWGAGAYDPVFYFDRDEDLLRLSRDGETFDEVHWVTDSSGTWPAEARKSIELDPDAFDPTENDDLDAWCLADTSYTESGAPSGPDYGSPGEVNGGCP